MSILRRQCLKLRTYSMHLSGIWACTRRYVHKFIPVGCAGPKTSALGEIGIKVIMSTVRRDRNTG